ncbi:MAG: maleate cis-trans isomerase family protein [Betaproteobacteria bacterium]
MSPTNAHRLGFLVPPGNPTVETEVIALARAMQPPRVSVHFTRMVAHGEAGAHQGFEERMRSQIAHVADSTALLAMVKPKVIVMAHTGMSAILGKAGEIELIERMQRTHCIPFLTAFHSVMAALGHLGAKRVALGTPYDAASTLRAKAHLEAHGVEVVSHGQLRHVINIYDETPERARELARSVDVPAAQAVFLSGLGMPTVAALDSMERDLGKPVVSGVAACMWHALRVAGAATPIPGFGRLLAA